MMPSQSDPRRHEFDDGTQIPRDGVPVASTGPRPRILLVEDDQRTRTALAQWLSHDYEVVCAADGVEGLELAATSTPDVIIADVWMPRLDGISMVQRIKRTEEQRHIPVIFLTGQTALDSVVAGIASGARAYLSKPVDLDVLERKLRSALAFRSAHLPT